jgi:hypothetical protein
MTKAPRPFPLIAAAEAFAAGYGGIAAVATATGMAPSTIGRGLKELAQGCKHINCLRSDGIFPILADEAGTNKL